jgi:D-serine deaminase-like pyridoxal phosphate-dependent protein
MRIVDLQTPCLVLDRKKMESNIARMKAVVADLDVSLRPHVKTNKCVEISRMLVAGHKGGITVSTLAEARYFFDAGFEDILYAVGIVPGKLDLVSRLRADGANLRIILDDPGTATEVAAFAASSGVDLEVLLEFDCDGHRAGFDPQDPDLLRTARILAGSRGTRFHGLLTHAGASYDCRNIDEIRGLARHEWQSAADCVELLRLDGLECPLVSVGSTPTTIFATAIDGVTEVRAGVYVFFDLFQMNLGVCTRDDIALTVLATIIGHKPALNRLIIDAGALALSKDIGTASQDLDCRYGLLCDAKSGEFIDGLVVDQVNQEHGIVVGKGGPIDFRQYPIGSKIRVLPIHACMTAAAHDRYYVVNGDNPQIEAEWQRCRGW